MSNQVKTITVKHSYRLEQFNQVELAMEVFVQDGQSVLDTAANTTAFADALYQLDAAFADYQRRWHEARYAQPQPVGQMYKKHQ